MKREIGRSPYLILGIRVGASPDEARRAYAMKARAIKTRATNPYTIEDLNWALHQMELSDDLHSSLDHYRVPANPAVFSVGPAESGLFSPRPEAMRRRTDSGQGELAALVQKEARQRVVRSLAKRKLPIVLFVVSDEGETE